ncbi:MAG: hypothetical protein U5R06_00545 [candidate division KSB1 bacterium]|nr:hypothetical protein [candidate division KSB1 bacterium]
MVIYNNKIEKINVILVSLFIWMSCDNPVSNDKVDEVKFPDPVVEKTVRDVIDKPTGIIEKTDVENIRSLVIGAQAENLEGIQYCSGLVDLTARNCKVSDLTPIENLVKLKYLDLEYNLIKNIKPLQNLVHLKKLFLSYNRIIDISSIINLDTLEIVTLSCNQIDSLPNLKNMRHLRNVFFDFNNISTMEPFLELSSIENIAISHNRIIDLTILYNASWLTAQRNIYIHLKSNPLDENSINNIIPDLKDRYDVRIYYQ